MTNAEKRFTHQRRGNCSVANSNSGPFYTDTTQTLKYIDMYVILASPVPIIGIQLTMYLRDYADITEVFTDLKLQQPLHTKESKQEEKDDITSKKVWRRSSMPSLIEIG